MVPAEALAQVVRRGAAHRLAAASGRGSAGARGAVHSGTAALGRWGEAGATGWWRAATCWPIRLVPAAMVGAFQAAKGALGDRLMAALKGGLAAGGEAGPVHSAGLMIVDRLSWPVADLRVRLGRG